MIYISHSQKDNDIVRSICNSLIERGVQCFVDYDQTIGEDHAHTLTKRIEMAEAVILFYSANTENSIWVKHEIEFSLSNDKNIIPVLLTAPHDNGWFHLYLGNISRIYFEGCENIGIVTDNIIKALNALYGKNDRCPLNGRTDARLNCSSTELQSAIPRKTLIRQKRYHWILCVIIGIVAVFLCFALFRTTGSVHSATEEGLSSTGNHKQMDSLLLKQREDELISKVEDLLLSLQQHVENPSATGNDDSPQSIMHEIEVTLGVDSIPFNSYGINPQQDLYNAFRQYKETVYSVLRRRIAEMKADFERKYSNNASFKSAQDKTRQERKRPLVHDFSSNDKSLFWLFMVISFFVGCGIMAFISQIIRNLQKYNIKLSSNIASKISIDGDLYKEIESREVYSTRLERGEYLIDFEDKNDESRHKTFNYAVTTKDSKLIFANFAEESFQDGKTIKCFIAGSKTLQQERDALRAVTCVMYNKWNTKNFRILSYTFEDFTKEHTHVPPQELYNRFIEKEADWSLFILDGDVGGITADEYRVAMDSFKKNGRPKILALAKVGSENNAKVAEIKTEINKEHQYWTDYTDIVSLKYIFESTLNWDLIRMFQDR